MKLSEHASARILEILETLYGDRAAACFEKLLRNLEAVPSQQSNPHERPWSQRDVVLITYGDQVRERNAAPLNTLRKFLTDYGLERLLSTVHILPCFPYTSDDGFAISDYRKIDPDLGQWNDLSDLGREFQLMLDLVLNHCSSQHEWFQSYLAGRSPYDAYFREAEPDCDVSAVVRPRSAPLLTPFETSRGIRHVWTTFSDDQIDLDYSNPDVLLEMLDILMLYVRHGARILRLDAIAYLWKKVGTSCVHLPETHLVVKLMRLLLDAVAPGTLLLTETNVPHDENISYFGDGDEAHMVYQFSLAPLLLDAFLSEDATPLMQWLGECGRGMPSDSVTTFLNFTASHDGVGVRPLEGLVSPKRFNRLVQSVAEFGGHVSTKRNSDGTDSPYELNISYFSALNRKDDNSLEDSVRRFLSSQAIMLALRGVPAVYFHSLVGTPNYEQGVIDTGRARSINRRKYLRRELDEAIRNPASAQHRIFQGYRKMLATRIEQPAFHPDAQQQVLPVDDAGVISFLRTSATTGQRIWSLTNVTHQSIRLNISSQNDFAPNGDLLTGEPLPPHQAIISLPPWTTVWLSDTLQ